MSDSAGTVTRVSLHDAVAAYERDLIQDALKTTRGNRAKAARLLDTTERILNYKVRGHGIDGRHALPKDCAHLWEEVLHLSEVAQEQIDELGRQVTNHRNRPVE